MCVCWGGGGTGNGNGHGSEVVGPMHVHVYIGFFLSSYSELAEIFSYISVRSAQADSITKARLSSIICFHMYSLNWL